MKKFAINMNKRNFVAEIADRIDGKYRASIFYSGKEICKRAFKSEIDAELWARIYILRMNLCLK